MIEVFDQAREGLIGGRDQLAMAREEFLVTVPVGVLAIPLPVEDRDEVDAPLHQPPREQEALPQSMAAVTIAKAMRLLLDLEEVAHLRCGDQGECAVAVDAGPRRLSCQRGGIETAKEIGAAGKIGGPIEGRDAEVGRARIALDLEAIVARRRAAPASGRAAARRCRACMAARRRAGGSRGGRVRTPTAEPRVGMPRGSSISNS